MLNRVRVRLGEKYSEYWMQFASDVLKKTWNKYRCEQHNETLSTSRSVSWRHQQATFLLNTTYHEAPMKNQRGLFKDKPKKEATNDIFSSHDGPVLPF